MNRNWIYCKKAAFNIWLNTILNINYYYHLVVSDLHGSYTYIFRCAMKFSNWNFRKLFAVQFQINFWKNVAIVNFSKSNFECIFIKKTDLNYFEQVKWYKYSHLTVQNIQY
jgi:hypothetical protein